MKTKTLIGKQIKKKTNIELVETVIAAKKHKAWLKVAGILSGPRRKRIDLNLIDLNKNTKESDVLVVPGKVLSQGEISKKVKVVALNFSQKAKDKLSKAKCGVVSILEEIKKNPEGKGIKILK